MTKLFETKTETAIFGLKTGLSVCNVIVFDEVTDLSVIHLSKTYALCFTSVTLITRKNHPNLFYFIWWFVLLCEMTCLQWAALNIFMYFLQANNDITLTSFILSG